MFLADKLNKGGSLGGYQISRSLRFNSADSAYLNRTPASAGNRRTWTFSTWVKRSKLDSGNAMLATVSGSALNYFSFGTSSGDFLAYAYFDGATDVFNVNTNGTSVFRDVSAWYHIVLSVDTTQATASNRVKIYVNNVQQTLGGTYPTQNYDTPINNTISNIIGGATGSYTAYLSNQYMTEINFIDGQALTPSSFGETNADTGVWQPKAYSGSYGTNGFYLNFSDNSNTTAATLGADYSGNGNNWTPNNFSVTAGAGNDSLVDSPTSYGTDTGVGGTVRGNYATINPLQLIANVSVSNGNLYLQSNNNLDQFASAPSTIAVRTGKWYAEFTASAVAGTPSYVFGVGRASWSPIITDGGSYYGRWWYTSEGYAYHSNGNFYTNNASVGTGATFANGDIIGVAMDLDAGSIAFYKNGTLQGTPFTSIPLGVDYVFAGGAFTFSYPTPTNIAAFFANFGQRPFAYTAPSGFKALCTQNLPTPTIGATTATQAGKYFNPVLWTGNGSFQTISGVGFQPDFIWLKARSNAYSYQLQDVVRGLDNVLASNGTGAEYLGSNTYGYVQSVNSNGFVVFGGALGPQHTNESGVTYVAWNWKANGSGSTNTLGSITSTVSANTTSGFSVVTYTGTGANATVGHGLGAVPSMVIVKSRTLAGGHWTVYHSALGNTKGMLMNTSDSVYTNSGFWNNTNPTSTVFTVGTDGSVNQSSQNQVAYCFAEISGYSKAFSYTGNGSADGAFVFTNMRPAYVLLKRTDTTGNWIVWDTVRNTYNVMGEELYPNLSNAGSTATDLDVLSNGFKLRNTTADFNASGGTYIGIAFASVPFKFSLGR
jgi:hypothetical protein